MTHLWLSIMSGFSKGHVHESTNRLFLRGSTDLRPQEKMAYLWTHEQNPLVSLLISPTIVAWSLIPTYKWRKAAKYSFTSYSLYIDLLQILAGVRQMKKLWVFIRKSICSLEYQYTLAAAPSEGSNTPQMKHWCCLYSQFLHQNDSIA